MGKILITGADGAIGKELRKAWKEKQLICFDRNLGQEMTNANDLRSVFQEPVDTVIHLAALSRVRNADIYRNELARDNVESIQFLIWAVKELENKPKVIFSSSREIYGNVNVSCSELMTPQAINAYGQSKVLGECLLTEAAMKYNFPLTILRLSNVYGCMLDHPDRFFPRIRDTYFNGHPMIIFGGNQKLDFLHVDDLIEAFLRIVNRNQRSHPVEIFNLASGKSRSLLDVVDIIETSFGSLPIIRAVGNESEVKCFYADISRARDELGFSPAIRIEEGIQRYFNTYIER